MDSLSVATPADSRVPFCVICYIIHGTDDVIRSRNTKRRNLDGDNDKRVTSFNLALQLPQGSPDSTAILC